MRAIWKGAVSFGLVNVPVRLYSATENHDVQFRQVHREDGGRIKYQRVCSIDGEQVAFDDIAKGFETEDGDMVVLTDEDFKDLPSRSSKEISVEKFVPADEIDPMLLDKSYYLEPDKSGWNFYLCTRKDVRVGKGGEYLALVLQDASGQVAGRLFDGVERGKREFEIGEFVRAEGRTGVHNGELQLVVTGIRRVNPDQDAAQGFREEDCVPSAPRPAAAMWADLLALVDGVTDRHLRVFLLRLLQDHETALRDWPAAQSIHHAYRGGLLEHILSMATIGRQVAAHYGAREDLLVAGAVIHDIGKLQELAYDNGAISYTRDGNLVGHIALGIVMVREAARGISGFPDELRAELEHLVASHHGARDKGAPVEPKSVEAFILAAVDDLDAKLFQVNQALGEAGTDPAFTGWHRRFGRVLYRGSKAG